MMNIATYILLALVLLYIGRKVGWAISRHMYTAQKGLVILFGLTWGVVIAIAVRVLIDVNQPGIIMRWGLGYLLGAYVSIPNFGLFNESTIPPECLPQHDILRAVPFLWYIVLSIVMAFRKHLFGGA